MYAWLCCLAPSHSDGYQVENNVVSYFSFWLFSLSCTSPSCPAFLLFQNNSCRGHSIWYNGKWHVCSAVAQPIGRIIVPLKVFVIAFERANYFWQASVTTQFFIRFFGARIFHNVCFWRQRRIITFRNIFNQWSRPNIVKGFLCRPLSFRHQFFFIFFSLFNQFCFITFMFWIDLSERRKSLWNSVRALEKALHSKIKEHSAI